MALLHYLLIFMTATPTFLFLVLICAGPRCLLNYSGTQFWLPYIACPFWYKSSHWRCVCISVAPFIIPCKWFWYSHTWVWDSIWSWSVSSTLVRFFLFPWESSINSIYFCVYQIFLYSEHSLDITFAFVNYDSQI